MPGSRWKQKHTPISWSEYILDLYNSSPVIHLSFDFPSQSTFFQGIWMDSGGAQCLPGLWSLSSGFLTFSWSLSLSRFAPSFSCYVSLYSFSCTTTLLFHSPFIFLSSSICVAAASVWLLCSLEVLVTGPQPGYCPDICGKAASWTWVTQGAPAAGNPMPLPPLECGPPDTCVSLKNSGPWA